MAVYDIQELFPESGATRSNCNIVRIRTDEANPTILAGRLVDSSASRRPDDIAGIDATQDR